MYWGNRSAALLALAALVAPALSASGGGAPTPAQRDALAKKIEAVLDREKGPGILSYAEARKLAADLKTAGAEVEEYRKLLAKLTRSEQERLKLDSRRVNVLESRVRSWNEDPVWPCMDDPNNRDNRKWLDREGIRGQRILARRSASGTWRWRILVEKQTRSDSRMTAWIKAEAKRLTPAQWATRYPGSDHQKALTQGEAATYHVHHRIPLYVGVANGGVDDGRNYVLLKEADHRKEHSTTGDAFTKWGSPRLYVTRGREYDEVDDTGDD